MDEYNVQYLAADYSTRKTINNAVLPIFECTDHNDYKFTKKVKNTLAMMFLFYHLNQKILL
jgi:hypothetical protein